LRGEGFELAYPYRLQNAMPFWLYRQTRGARPVADPGWDDLV